MRILVGGVVYPPASSGMPVAGGAWDAGEKRITAVSAPQGATDAVNLGTLEQYAPAPFSIETHDATPTHAAWLNLGAGAARSVRITVCGRAPGARAIDVERHALVSVDGAGVVTIHQGDAWPVDPVGSGWDAVPGPDGSTHVQVIGHPGGVAEVLVVGLLVDTVQWTVRVAAV